MNTSSRTTTHPAFLNTGLIFVGLAISMITSIFWSVHFWSAAGLLASLYFFWDFTRKTGEYIPIPQLIVFLSALQWIVGPYIDYHNEIEHYKYKMYVPEDEYMAFAVPGVILIWYGLSLFPHQLSIVNIKESIKALLLKHPNLPYKLVAIGILAPFISGFFPSGLSFVFFLLGQVKYIGALYFILSGHPNRWPIFAGLMMLSAAGSLATGMFHDLLLWLVLTATFIFHELKFGIWQKISVIIAGLFFAVTIQAVKHQYRKLSPEMPGNMARVGLFFKLATDEWKDGKFINPVDDNEINVRLNQGWIISKIMEHIPEHEPFANGTTIKDALEAAFLPRIIAPNKKMAGGQENFKKYTGLPLGEGTSMGISLAGEGWANFGYGGGILFLFGWGLLVGWFWKKLNQWSRFFPTLLVWSPILFLQTVKAETELVVVLNHLIKSAVLVFGLLYFFYRFRGVKI